MATRLEIGPKDQGLPLALEEFLSADGAEGYRYELIEGKLSVSPRENVPQKMFEPGSTCTTDLLLDFQLVIKPRT